MNIAVIPARGGSKRIPRKNIRSFAGRPMLAHAIEAAQRSGLFAHIVVSTDDEEIAGVAVRYGAEVPFLRPPELADDHTPTVPVIAHALEFCRTQGRVAEHACCIYPATPFLQTEDMLAALQLLGNVQTDYVFPVARYASPVQRALRQLPDGKMQAMYSEYSATRTQDLEPAFFDAGQFYWGRAAAWLQGKNIHQHGHGLQIPAWRAVDIDTPEDWQRAELLYAACKLQVR